MRGRRYWAIVALTIALLSSGFVVAVQADLRHQQEERDQKFQEETCRIFPTHEGCP